MRRAIQAVLQRAARATDRDALEVRDPELVGALLPAATLLERYFRASVRGLEHIPAGPAMIVGNHNGGITFLEPLIFGAEFYRQRGTGERLYALAHDAIVALPTLGPLLRRLGAVRATRENGLRVLDEGHKLVVFPGGNYEAFRPYRERFTVDFGGHEGYARLALERDAPIVPMLSVGGHETFFVISRGRRLARMLGIDTALRSNAFPICAGLPWGLFIGPIFHLPLPAKCEVVLGAPMRPSEVTRGLPEGQKATALSAAVVGELQKMMDEAASRRRFPVLG